MGYKSYEPLYEGIMPGPYSQSVGRYKMLKNNVTEVVAKLVMGRLPVIIDGSVSVSLPFRGTYEGFPWTAQFKATDLASGVVYTLDGIVHGRKATVDVKQDHPFKWKQGDKLSMYAMYIHE